MRISGLVLILFFPAIPAAHSQSQIEMNAQAGADFEKADARLNKIYNTTLKSLDEIGRKKLIASERAWLAFRDAEATYEADSERGGSIVPMVYAHAATELTEQRIKMLQAAK